MKARATFLVCVAVAFLLGCGGDKKDPPGAQNQTCRVNEVPDFYFDSGPVSITYDAMGRVAAIKQSSFNVFSFTYNATGRVTRFLAGTSQFENLGAEEHTVTYDASGRIATINALDNAQTVTATPTYDAQNRITKISVEDPSGQRTYFKRMEYDAAGNVTKVFYAKNQEAEKLYAEYKYDDKKSPFRNQTAFQLIPLVSSLVDKSHYLSVNNPVQYKDFGYGYTATYQYSNDLPTETSLLLQQTGNPSIINKQKVYKYDCQ
jgi:YD repeat-containing protein